MAAKSSVPIVSKADYVSLGNFLEGRTKVQRVYKKESHSAALRKAGELYESRDYVSAYESFKQVYDKVASDMQRVLARNLEFEANKLARELQKPVSVAKTNIQSMRAHAQQIIDEFDRLRRDLENKPLVRAHLKKGGSAIAAKSPPVEEATPTILNTTNETQLDANSPSPSEVEIGDKCYKKAPYSPPEVGALYAVRDKAGAERIIRVLGKSPDGTQVQVETLDARNRSTKPIQLAADALARQAAKGWCSSLLAVTDSGESTASQPAPANPNLNVTMRLDIQNFGRCCADIARANIKFDTQLIKDVGDGPFRAGNYEQAFLTFEQLAVGYTSAVSASRRAIADGRRALTAEKGNLSGKEIQERTAAFLRTEQLIHTAEREFSTILEGLRMYLRAQQG